MSSTSEKSSTPKSFLATVVSVQNLVLFGIFWAVSALLFFLLFSIPLPDQELPPWYSYGTYIFELGAFLWASILCWRNWHNPQIVSGRNVWRGLALGMFFYLIGGMLFGWWELFWEQEPDVSPADMFYITSYIFLAWGMILAVVSRRLNLEWKQWLIVGMIAIGGITFAVWVSITPPTIKANNIVEPTESVAVAPAPSSANNTKAPPIKQQTGKKPTNTSSTNKSKATPAVTPAAKAEVEKKSVSVPNWVKDLEVLLSPLKTYVTLFYIVGDVLLLIIATTLLLAFWGGRFSQSWRMIAAATFSFYIADMWFKYAAVNIPEYQSGQLLEVFFVFSGVLFGIGAVLEHDLSTRSTRRTTGRRRGGGHQVATDN